MAQMETGFLSTSVWAQSPLADHLECVRGRGTASAAVEEQPGTFSREQTLSCRDLLSSVSILPSYR